MNEKKIDLRLYEALPGGLTQEIAQVLRRPGNEDLFFGIRNKRISVYYRGGVILDASKKALNMDSNYFNYGYAGEQIRLPFRDAQDWGSQLTNLRACMAGNTNGNRERDAQQGILHAVNANPDSEYHCVDMEYSYPGLAYGRFDLIAIRRQKENGKYLVALIELKYGTGSFPKKGGPGAGVGRGKNPYGSGIVGHAFNFREYLSDAPSCAASRKDLQRELFSMIRAYKALGLPQGKYLPNPESAQEIDVDGAKTWLLCVACEDLRAAKLSLSHYYGVAQGGNAQENIAQCVQGIDMPCFVTTWDPKRATNGSPLTALDEAMFSLRFDASSVIV